MLKRQIHIQLTPTKNLHVSGSFMYNILRKASNNPVAIFIPIFQMRMLRLKEVKCFALGHTAKKEEDWKLHLVSVKDQHTLLPHCSFPTVYQPHVYHLPYFSRIYSTPFSQFNIPEIGMRFINDSLLKVTWNVVMASQKILNPPSLSCVIHYLWPRADVTVSILFVESKGSTKDLLQ